jgi:hypothetical protein
VALAGTFEKLYGRDASIIPVAQAAATANAFPDNVEGSATGNQANAVLVSKFLEVSSNSSVVVNNFSGADDGGSPLKRVTLVE